MKLKDLRQSKKLSQIEFGERLGWSQHRVSRLESGRQEFFSADRELVKKEFGVEVDVTPNPTPFAPHSGDDRDKVVEVLEMRIRDLEARIADKDRMIELILDKEKEKS